MGLQFHASTRRTWRPLRYAEPKRSGTTAGDNSAARRAKSLCPVIGSDQQARMGRKVTHQVLGPEVRFPARNVARQAGVAHPKAGTLFLAALGEVAP